MHIRFQPILAGLILAATVCPAPAAIEPANSPTPVAATSPPLINASVPRHTVIPIIIIKNIRVGGAGDARQAKSIKAEVAQDIIINGLIVAKQGDLAEGHLTTEKNVTQRTFSQQTSQEASLDIDDVVNFCGDTIHMQFERTFVGDVRASFLSFGPHAHDAVFNKGTILKASTDRLEKSVCAETTTQAPLPLPENILLPDEDADSK
jgi:hypothetical protein